METQDNGTLAFLNIPRDQSNVQFHCEQTKQSKLLNTTFWVRDILSGVKTKHGEGRMLVMVSDKPDTQESECKKFFTNSSNIKYILEKVKEMNMFPRKVTMRCEGNSYYLE